jgi:hypothetical protein
VKSIKQAHDELQAWFDNDCVGVLLTFRAPKSGLVDQIIEETIKMREMDSDTRESVAHLCDVVDSEKIEIHKDKNGYPDRIKVVRRT